MFLLLRGEQGLEAFGVPLADQHEATGTDGAVHHVRGVAVAGDRHRYGVFPLPAEHVQRQLGGARLPFIAGEGRALDAPCEHEQCHQKADGEAQHTPHDGGLENETEDQDEGERPETSGEQDPRQPGILLFREFVGLRDLADLPPVGRIVRVPAAQFLCAGLLLLFPCLFLLSLGQLLGPFAACHHLTPAFRAAFLRSSMAVLYSLPAR